MVGATAPGTRAEVLVLREGERKRLTVVLDELPADEVAAATSPSTSGSGGALGLVVETPTPEVRAELGLPAGEGVVITQVTGAAARRAGLSPGDAILRVGRTPVASHRQFADAVKDVKPGDTVMLLVRRGDQNQFIALSPREGE